MSRKKKTNENNARVQTNNNWKYALGGERKNSEAHEYLKAKVKDAGAPRPRRGGKYLQICHLDTRETRKSCAPVASTSLSYLGCSFPTRPLPPKPPPRCQTPSPPQEPHFRLKSSCHVVPSLACFVAHEFRSVIGSVLDLHVCLSISVCTFTIAYLCLSICLFVCLSVRLPVIVSFLMTL